MGTSDTCALLLALAPGGSLGVLGTLNQLRGPWALVYWHAATATLWFGRDVFGRRSLLMHSPDCEDGCFILTSLAPLPPATGNTTKVNDPATHSAASAPPRPAGAASGQDRASAACGEASSTNPVDDPAVLSTAATGGCVVGQGASCRDADRDIAAGREAGGPDADSDIASGRPAESSGSLLNGPAMGPPQTSPAAPRCLARPSAGPGRDADSDEGEADTEGFWQELTPGIYSMAFSSCAEGELQAALPAVQHHPWTDALLQQLSSYQRTAVSGNREAAPAGPAPAAGADEQEVGAGGVTSPAPGDLDRDVSHQHCGAVPASSDAGQCTSLPDSLGQTAGGRHLQAQPDSSLLHVLAAGGSHMQDRHTACGDPCKLPGSLASNGYLESCAPSHVPVSSSSSAHDGHAAGGVTAADAAHPTGGCAHGASLRPGVVTRNPITDVNLEASLRLLEVMQQAVEVRCRCIDSLARGDPAACPSSSSGDSPPPPVMVLFSGGVDSMLIAALAHRVLPPEVPIDLSNVCFDSGRSPDRLAALAGLQELARYAPGRRWRLIEVDASLADVDRHRLRLLALLEPAASVMDLNIGAALWLAASGSGRLVLPTATSQHPSFGAPSDSVDCNTKQATSHAAAAAHTADIPVGREATPRHGREAHCTVVSPATTSQAAAAAPGPDMPDPSGQAGEAGAAAACYTSPARVVLLGHGADEQCAGYGRHRTKFKAGGWPSLAEELALDMRRLWRRNLGRDDRLVADRAREARHPFLDERCVAMLLDMPLHVIADLTQPPGTGDKRILRDALRVLGLHEAAGRVKRAIQFGSRIGKLANQRDFGSNRAANKVNAGSVALINVPRAVTD